jgi:hypothetical protein
MQNTYCTHDGYFEDELRLQAAYEIKRAPELPSQFSRERSACWGPVVKQLPKATIFQAARWSGLTPALPTVFAGRAAILMFHESQQDCRSELMTGTSRDLLECSLKWLRQQGWEIVSLEACLKRLAADPRPHRYAAITIDDGYRDKVSTALPILERNNAPFKRHRHLSDRKPNHFSLPRIGVGQSDMRAAFEARMNGVHSAVHMQLGQN